MRNTETTFYNGKATVFLQAIGLYEFDTDLDTLLAKLHKIRDDYADSYEKIVFSLEDVPYEPDTKCFHVSGVRDMTEAEKDKLNAKTKEDLKKRIDMVENELKRLKASQS